MTVTLTLTVSETARPSEIHRAWSVLGDVLALAEDIGQDVITEVVIDLPDGQFWEARLFLEGDEETDAWALAAAFEEAPNGERFECALWRDPEDRNLYRAAVGGWAGGARVLLLTHANGDDDLVPEGARPGIPHVVDQSTAFARATSDEDEETDR